MAHHTIHILQTEYNYGLNHDRAAVSIDALASLHQYDADRHSAPVDEDGHLGNGDPIDLLFAANPINNSAYKTLLCADGFRHLRGYYCLLDVLMSD
ncbi:hypothetical protein I7I48_10019 [Histoplasma ohiense]|nr:hypothetical protein I7I48_10019 [Histoplasma ohiense (nom. inval.)]